ncbi:acetoacetate decarboxylase family protein [Mycobacterium angelicum]|uniref:Acetoacetate decarboxylase n=1 Tax=Mycobacterium angelicum TaxID=470074 RepID=A0A1W9ZAV8_MYCAN|nr:acetoacetate decarboxylase family protein [Mycobacterium angelicum]MCV7199959.1 acetoacetate decarboxylase family protein [Mycobacterium angelicum]ORA10577.1 acetoacetate decarboxylase [Mycobacterium angelicum]
MAASQHTIAGTVLTMPVQIRKATQHMAMFSVDADAAQRMIDYSGLQVARFLPGRAAVVLVLAHFIDGDLGEYHELSTNVMVNQPGSAASGLRALQSAFVHQMLVDQAFTLEAGRTIWGFPKVMAEFAIRSGGELAVEVRADGRLLVDMEFARALPIPSALDSREQQLRSYAHREGHTLETAYTMTSSGSRYRPGGVRLQLGDHPYAKELASLGLPKRAMMSSSAANVQMTFGDAQEIS